MKTACSVWSAFLLLLLLLPAGQLSAKDKPLVNVKTFTTQDGFTSTDVTDILQARNGLIWLSSWNGLSSYDGQQFKHYKPAGNQVKYVDGEGTQYRDIRINKIAEDAAGNIICFARDFKLYAFRPAEELFYDLAELHPEISLPSKEAEQRFFAVSDSISYIFADGDYLVRNSGDWLDPSQTESVTLSKRHRVFNVLADSKGNEWILTDMGVVVLGFDFPDNQFPFAYLCEGTGAVFLATRDGLIEKYSYESNQLEYLPVSRQLGHCTAMQMLQNGQVAVCTDEGLLIFSPEDGRSQVIYKQEHILSLYEDSRGGLWLFSAGYDGILYYDPSKGEIRRLPSPTDTNIKHFVRTHRPFVYETPQKDIWVVTPSAGLCYYDRDQQRLSPYYINNSAESILSISCIRFLVDYQGNLWISGEKTMEKLCFKDRFFYKEWSLPSEENCVRCLYMDRRHRLWTASKSGVVRVFSSDKKFIGYLSSNGRIQKDYSNLGDEIYSILEDKRGYLWLAGRKRGLIMLEPRNEENTNYHLRRFTHSDNPFSLSSNDVFTLFEDSRGHLYVGCHQLNGLNIVEVEDDQTFRFIHPGNKLKNWPMEAGGKIRHITEDQQGNIIVGTTRGLICFSSDFEHPENISFSIKTISTQTGVPGDNDVIYSYVGKDGQIYVQYRTGLLAKLDGQDIVSPEATFSYYKRPESVQLKDACSVIEDKTGHIWIIYENGVARLINEKKQLEVTMINEDPEEELILMEATVVKGTNDCFYLGTQRDILSFYPGKIKKSRFTPPVFFSGITFHKNGQTLPVDPNKVLELNPEQRSFSLSFSALDFNAPNRIQYAYRMNGYEKEWHYVGNQHLAQYNLPKGSYQFVVRSTNSDNVWTDNDTYLTLKVVPTFWESGWAKLLWVLLISIFCLILIGYLLARNSIRMERNLAEIRMKDFTDTIHELRTPLSLIKGLIEDLIQRNQYLPDPAKKTLNLVHNNTERMNLLINQLLDLKKIQLDKMRLLLEEMDVPSTLYFLIQPFRMIADKRNIQLGFFIEEDAKDCRIWADKDKFGKIITNLLSNAFKYSPDGRTIGVSVSQEADFVSIKVTDQGIGIPAEKIDTIFKRYETLDSHSPYGESTGLGLFIVQELVKMHHGQILVESKEGMGSTFDVRFLKGRNHFEKDNYAEVSASVLTPLEKRESPLTKTYSEAADGGASYVTKKQPGSNTEAPAEEIGDRDSILIVDDNNEMRSFLSSLLKEEYNVTCAVNGKEGLQKAIALIPDLIISDVIMPELDGVQMLNFLRKNPETQRIPVILLTAEASIEDAISNLAAGADDYLAKPFSPGYLKVLIHNRLLKRREIMEFYLKGNNDSTEESSYDVTESEREFIRQVEKHIEENLDNTSLTVEDLAKKMCVSHSVLYRRIKTIFGMTPVTFISYIRINHAIELLKTTEKSVSEISDACGFSSPAYFSYCFRKQTGASPTQYR